MKIITTNLLNRFWQKGIKPVLNRITNTENKLNEIATGYEKIGNDISALNGSLQALIYARSQIVSIGTIGTLSDYNASVNCDIPNGYAPAGILGWQIGGNYCSWIVPSRMIVQNNKIAYTLHNTASASATNIDITFVILYIKSSSIKI